MSEPEQRGWQHTKLGQAFAGRRVLVTGHTGFKGSWLTLWLLELGASVVGISNDCLSGSHFERLALSADIEEIRCDIRDEHAFRAAMVQADADVAIHMAAQALVGCGNREPVMTFATNTMGVVHFLEGLRHCPGTKAAVVVTSDKVYARIPGDNSPHSEGDPLGGEEPYSASKACAEIAFQAYRDHFFQSRGPLLASVRAGNVIGGGDHSLERLIPDCIRHWRQGRPVSLRTPMAIRPWQHVLDALCGYLLVIAGLLQGRRELHGQAFNIGPADMSSTNVQQLVEQLASSWSDVPQPAFLLTEQTSDALRHWERCLRVDPGLASQTLGWKSLLTVEDALTLTTSWYRDAADGNCSEPEELRQRSVADLEAFRQAAIQHGVDWL